jgi:lysophospholipase L1-like esterase
MMFHHPDRPEFLATKFSQGHDEMRALASSLGISFTDLLPLYSPHGVGMYRDGIHPNVQGQEIISNALYNAVLPNLNSVQPI